MEMIQFRPRPPNLAEQLHHLDLTKSSKALETSHQQNGTFHPPFLNGLKI